ncbi:O-antigen ligase family protein [Methylopila musalis]|uniref:O-antigen ligase family protein n=1 Tax=Methylopila musalis TaxID=1134781 RepID=A0ABW3ZCD3_9HYPH
MPNAALSTPLTAPATPRAGVAWAAGLHAILLHLFLLYVFVGAQPFQDPSAAQRVEGNIIDRFGVLALFGLALVVLALNARRLPALIPGLAGLGAIVVICLSSVLWSDFPDLTIRRALLLTFLAVIAASCASGLKSLRQFHTALFAVTALVIVLNVVGSALAPGFAVTDLGLRGMYSQKNVAGIAAMITAVTAATWTLGAARRRHVALGLLALALALGFLLLTRSKTSIALTGLALAGIAAFALTEKLGPRFALLLAAAAAFGVCVFLAAFAAFDFDPVAFSAVFTGDASFTGRDELWAFALKAAQERFWLGHGYGAFWDVGPDNDPLNRIDPGTWLGDVEVGTINQAHNGFLELWLHIGLPAVVLATVVVATGMVAGLAGAASAQAPRAERAALGLIGVVLALHLLHNLTEATLFVRGIPFCNVAILCIAALSCRRALAHEGRSAYG